ncbi:MAG: DUF1428 domain-containing protein [Oligoflexia bacterium]|nr:DUF1428 domain-containing protein [Oligoflexia bacterium]
MKKSFRYVDGFVLPVPKSKVNIYRKWAKVSARVWLDHGAIDYVECIADDVKPGKVTSFPQSVKLKKGEVVFLSWITYKSKAHRDRVLKKAMSDPRLAELMNSREMPFDGMRMFWGGFKPVVSDSRSA